MFQLCFLPLFFSLLERMEQKFKWQWVGEQYIICLLLPRTYTLMIEPLPELCLSFFLDSVISVFHLGASYGQGLKFCGIDSKGKLLLSQVIFHKEFLFWLKIAAWPMNNCWPAKKNIYTVSLKNIFGKEIILGEWFLLFLKDSHTTGEILEPWVPFCHVKHCAIQTCESLTMCYVTEPWRIWGHLLVNLSFEK